MARVSLNCSCGWNFFIPGSTPGHEVACPSCGQTVRIPGRKPGQDVPLTAGAIAAEKQRQQKMIKLMVGVGALVVVAAVTIILFSMGSEPPPDPNALADGADQGLTGLGAPRGARKAMRDPILDAPPPPPPPPPPALYNAAQIEELRRGVMSNIWLTNMTAIMSECMRYRNLTNEWAQFQAEIATYDGKIKYNLGELAKVGEKMSLEPYLAQGDQFLGFALRDFTTAKAGEAALHLQRWLKNWVSGPQLEQVNIQRGDKKMTLYLQFPEATKELLQLLRHPFLELEGNPDAGAPGIVLAIPADVLKDITGRFESLPAGYRGYLPPADGKRLEQLLLARKGAQEDLDWLQTRILGEALPSFQREADLVRSKVLELEPKLKENVASDVIYRKNGTKFEGQIIAETAERVKIKGLYGAVEISREDILKIEKGKGAATEFPARFAEAKGKLEKLAPLLAWCAEKNIKREREYVAYVILTLDASNEKARNAVGLARPTITGQVVEPPKYPATTGQPTMEGVDKAVEAIANDVTSRSKVFTDVVTEMRRRTETLTTTSVPYAPENAARAVTIIGNPLTFRPGELSTTQLLEIGSWWGALSPQDRRQFAKYYGLWCAFTRGQKR